MNISRKWLSDYVALDCDDQTLCDKLTMAGIEVEKVDRISTFPEEIVTARILERRPHPDSDHLSLCRVDSGSGELQIVCGAPNCDAGRVVPLAPIGTVFTTAEGEFKIKKSKLRGVESFGMLCSQKELGLGPDHSGLLILPDDTPVGVPLARLYPGDTQIEVEVTPNRPDWLSMWGIARDVSCLFDVEPKFPEIEVPECAVPAPGLVTVEDSELCPRYIGRIIRNVKIGPSPRWLAERLESVGLRPINNVVDVTNFVLMELGQPLHAFDLDKLAGRRVVARRAHPGEKIVTLDGSELELSDRHLVIADAEKPMALAGIMGGEYSGITDNTVNLLIESAVFKPANIRATSRELGISSDSSYRFERGVDFDMAETASRRAVQLILATAGGELGSEAVDVRGERPADAVIPCEFDRIRALIGVEVSNERMIEIFRKLHLGVSDITAAGCVVTAPGFRRDLSREADLAEEVARIHGLDQIPEIPVTGKRCHPASEDACAPLIALRDRVIGLGFDECVHYSIVSDSQALSDGRFERGDLITLSNPINSDAAAMRPSLFCVMTGAVERNVSRGNRDLTLFELGKVFCANPEKFPEERYELALLLTGRRHPEEFGAEGRAEYDFYDLKGAVETLLELCGLTDRRYRFESLESDRRFRPGRAARLVIDGREAGAFGEVAEPVARHWRTTAAVFIAQIEAAALLETGRGRASYRPLALYPAVARDVAFVAAAELEHGKVVEFIRSCRLPFLESVRLFDIFTDDRLAAEGRKSMAYSLTFRNPERTLTDVEVNVAMEKLRSKLAAGLKVELR